MFFAGIVVVVVGFVVGHRWNRIDAKLGTLLEVRLRFHVLGQIPLGLEAVEDRQ
jgi:hypothetical protein